MTLIPGDTYRISISGADSSILVDSWNSVITANVRAGDDSTLVDIYQKKFFGTVDGKLDGLVVNSVGDIVLHPGTEHEAALYTGDVTGDVTGNLTGDVTGDLSGDVIAADDSVIVNHVTKAINASSITTDTFSVTNFSIDRLDVNSIYGDTFTGHVVGDVVGDLTGDTYGLHNGNVVGNVTGNVTGTLTGDVAGNLTGNVTGGTANISTLDVTGTASFATIQTNSITSLGSGTFTQVTANEFVGPVSGNIIGNVYADANTCVVNIQDGQSIGIAAKSNKVAIGKDDGSGTINLNYNMLNSFVQLPTQDNHAPHKFMAYRGTLDNPQNLNVGDHMNLHSVTGYVNNKYTHAGAFGFFINPEKTHSPTDTHVNTGFVIAVSGANHGPNLLAKKRVTVDDLGCLRAGILQTSTYTATERNEFTPATGMIIFNTSTNKFQGYNGTSWVDLS
jgi:hypothetical protein